LRNSAVMRQKALIKHTSCRWLVHLHRKCHNCTETCLFENLYNNIHIDVFINLKINLWHKLS